MVGYMIYRVLVQSTLLYVLYTVSQKLFNVFVPAAMRTFIRRLNKGVIIN